MYRRPMILWSTVAIALQKPGGVRQVSVKRGLERRPLEVGVA